ncbi:MAG: FMN-binding protein [Woeseiaceae bacterium]|nr:FMN-binding protein [Woeseiaceae bacterium]
MSPKIRKTILATTCSLLLVSFVAFAAGEAGQYQTRAEFLVESFGTDTPANAVVWIDDELRAAAMEILGHPPAYLRMRYWYDGARTAWIIDEIGKDLAITFGVVIENQEIQFLRVMQFRESRGWEIRYPFFTRQFSQLRLSDTSSLSHGIDGISGATLSVKAATRSATFALVLDEYTKRTRQTPDTTP